MPAVLAMAIRAARFECPYDGNFNTCLEAKVERRQLRRPFTAQVSECLLSR